MSRIKLQQGEFCVEVEDDRAIEGLVKTFEHVLKNHTNVVVADAAVIKDVAVS